MSHFQKRLELLKRPAFLAYAIGFFCAAIGNGMGYIAMSWIVISHHPSVSAMAILMSCFWLPNVVLGPMMGVFADRLSRKNMIIASHVVRAIILIGFSFYLIHHFNLIDVYAMMLCIGIAFSAFFSSTSGFIRELMPPEDLMYANFTTNIMYELGNMIGMGSAGLLIAWTSSETAIFINGCAFVVATLTMLCISKKVLCHGGERIIQKIQLWQDFKDGLRYLSSNKKLRTVYTIQMLIFAIFLTCPILLVPFSKIILRTTVEQFGIIEASASVGIVIGGLFMPWIAEKIGFMRTMLFFSIVLCVTFCIFVFNRSIDYAAIMYFIIGFAGAVWALIMTEAQRLTAIDFQGRTQTTYNSLSGAIMLLFYFSIGWIGSYIAVNHLYFIEVLMALLSIIFLLRSQERV